MILEWLDPNTGWGVLLDGTIGGVIGGLATAGAVWWTLKDQRKTQAATELRTQVAQLHGSLFRLNRSAGRRDLKAVNDDLSDVVAQIFLVMALSAPSDPVLTRDIQAALDRQIELWDGPVDEDASGPLERQADLCRKFITRLNAWLADREEYATVAPLGFDEMPGA